ncbi:TetR/AcrR family transcriptional regulator [Effusibacillus consociatus]|uniref:TetR/AcrR family transcriptional regulator n=1 Tax=Effusibacillus consociatus TaxID=1117041 RepID=A0ABV9PXL1_9BACL
MRKGERTRVMILEKAAGLLNRQGYLSTPISEIMQETGLEKGGIYNHFTSKEELAIQAFHHSVNTMRQHFAKAYQNKTSSVDRLFAVMDVFRELGDNPPLPGGCPLMNAAIESDDAHPVLSSEVRQAMAQLYNMMKKTVLQGIQEKELSDKADADAVATVLISTLEGALMMTKLYKDSIYMERAIDHLKTYIESLRVPV